MKALNFPLIRLVCFFILGVVLGYNIEFPLGTFLVWFGGCGLLFALTYFFGAKYLFGTMTYAMFLILGFITTKIHEPTNRPDHYMNHLGTSVPENGNGTWTKGKVIEVLNSGRYADKYILELISLEQQPVEGRLLLNVAKDSLKTALNVDDILVFKEKLSPIPEPRNPHQFNYSDFMKNRKVFRQAYCGPNDILVWDRPKHSLLGSAEKIREQMVSLLRENGFSSGQLGIIQALLLGQTQAISGEIRDSYAAAGVVHILSVSGLHVGFVLLIFDFLLKFLERIRYGKFLKVLLLIVLMWGFALLAGFSSPVVRSVTMFTFVAIGLNMGRRTNILNILFLSLLGILLIEPRFVFEMGFQLSYLAVFSIVIFQPVLYGFLKPKNKVSKFVWGTTTVSLAAQIGILPLSFYYFHQFPGLFLFANLLVVPMVGFLLGFLMFAILLAFLGILPPFFAKFTGGSIDFMNFLVQWFARQDSFLVQNIHFPFWAMWGSYMVLFSLVLVLWRFSYKKVVVLGSVVIFLLGVFIMGKHQNMRSSKLLIFHKSRKTMLAIKTGKKMQLLHNLGNTKIREEYSISNYMIGEAIDEISQDSLKNVYRVGDEMLFVVDSSGVYEMPQLRNSHVLLRNSPRINLERLLVFLEPKKIIVDGSNYLSYIGRWRETCSKHDIPFHSTRENGAFVIDFE